MNNIYVKIKQKKVFSQNVFSFVKKNVLDQMAKLEFRFSPIMVLK